MGLTKGDLLKSYLENFGNKLVFEKVDLGSIYGSGNQISTVEGGP
jgi:hypothetical protein